MTATGEGLDTLKEDGSVPETRMASASDARNRVTSFIDSDNSGRARQRALVKGLVDGNPPYNQGALIKAGRGDACNVNWRIAESYLSDALDLFYDISSEAPTCATILLGDHVKDSEREKKSRIVTEEFHRMIQKDRSHDGNMQTSMFETVLYGKGPLIFEDEYTWRTKPVLAGEGYAPENASSDCTEWEEFAIRSTYYPHQLYNWIRNAKGGSYNGWNVEATKKAIIQSHQKNNESRGQHRNWDWHQQQLKNNSYSYSGESKTIEVAHYIFREFPGKNDDGKLTHTIVVLDGDFGGEEFLFRKERRFDNWDQFIHPMYYNYMGGGFYHAITGMGVKMYSAMDYQNRLLCKLAEDAFSPKILFKPSSANADQTLQIQRFGPWGKLPSGFEAQQSPVAGFLDEGLTMNRELSGIINSNLSQFRANLQKNQGNPLSATEATLRAQNQSQLGKSQLARYYMQLDWLYAEKYRRATAKNYPSSADGYKEAKDFVDRCEKRGVTKAELRDPELVQATRIVGQGSVFLRQQVLERMLGIISLLPKGGQDHLLADYTAAMTGQHMVERYMPALEDRPQDDHVTAALQVAAMKDGVGPVVTDQQDHVVFAQVYLEAATGAAASLSQDPNANPYEVLQFLNIIGPAIFQRLSMFAQNPARQAIHKEMFAQWKDLSEFTNQLTKQLEKQQQEQANMQAQQQTMMTMEQLKAMQMQAEEERKNAQNQSDIQRKQAKTALDMELKTAKARQNMAIADVKTAQEIRRNGESQEGS